MDDEFPKADKMKPHSPIPAQPVYSIPAPKPRGPLQFGQMGEVTEYQGEGPMTLPTHPFSEGPSAVNKASCDNLLQAVIVNFWKQQLFGWDNRHRWSVLI